LLQLIEILERVLVVVNEPHFFVDFVHPHREKCVIDTEHPPNVVFGEQGKDLKP
jgi:hypothetical protein